MTAVVGPPASIGSSSFKTLGSNNPFRDYPASLATSEIATSSAATVTSRRRGSSLTARFPGDTSHRPLDVIRHEQKVANRSRRRSHVAADTIDKLDMLGVNGFAYHHDGPYDATLLARNLDPQTSPVAATKFGNMEAIRATPRELVDDSLIHHRPFSGTASIPSGVPDRYGRTLCYREGSNLNVEMGRRHCDGINHYMTDVQPEKSADYNRMSSKSHRRVISEGGVELQDRSTFLGKGPQQPLIPKGISSIEVSPAGKTSDSIFDASSLRDDLAETSGLRRAHTTGKRTTAMASALRSKFGSLRRRNPQETRELNLS